MMDFWKWLGSWPWEPIGVMLTALFTGFTAWRMWWHRDRSKLVIDPLSFEWGPLPRTSAILKVAVRNLGNKPVYGLRVLRERPGAGSVVLTHRVAALSPGESIELSIWYAADNAVVTLNEKTGEYPCEAPIVDFGNDFVELVSFRPPRFRHEDRKRHLITDLHSELGKIHW